MSNPPDVVRVAAVQASPVHMNLNASIDKAIALAEQARDKDCQLIAFGEAWLPGYPYHIWLGAPIWGMQFIKPYYENCLDLEGPEFQRLLTAAKRLGIMIAMGYSEKAGGSLYLGQCLIGADGALIFARRKLKPTHVERSVYGEGYGEDLVVADTPIGKVGSLCCWEHVQPLSKYAMYSQGEAIHVAAWPSFSVYNDQAYALGREVNMNASQLYAVEGQNFVIAATSLITQDTLDKLQINESNAGMLQLGGGSAMIFAPDGRRMMEYLPGDEEGLQIADLPMEAIIYAKAFADPAGHYSKPESTQLILRKSPRKAVIIEESETGEHASLTQESNENGAG
jgi:arylacetonitrilase